METILRQPWGLCVVVAFFLLSFPSMWNLFFGDGYVK
jgi:hypothetical protein